MRKNDVVEFKGHGLVFETLGRALKLFEPNWDRWGWHMGIVWSRGYEGWHILEATGRGVELNFYDGKWLAKNTRNYTWFDIQPSEQIRHRFLQSHMGKKYDIAIYFWTTLAIILRHYFNHPIPKLFDDRFDCWELAAEFCAEGGKPIVSKYDTIIITDMIRNLKRKQYGQRNYDNLPLAASAQIS